MKNLLLFVLGCLPVLVWGQFKGGNIISYPHLEYQNSITTVDIDKDGDKDILTYSSFPNKSKSLWLENDGRNNFIKTHNIIETGKSIHRMSTGDIDSDGSIDVVVSISDTNSLLYPMILIRM